MKNNLPPTAAISAHIDRSMPKSVAWMVYSTDEIDAQMALSAGFVSQVVPAGELYTRSDDALKIITERNRTSLETCKTYLANARLMEVQQASDYAANLLALVMSSK
jgi:enoyl-CoA hydratase/carnithine racemase